MTYIEDLLSKRGLTSPFKSDSKSKADIKAEIRGCFEKEIYGIMPSRPDHLKVEVIGEDRSFGAGSATHKILKFIASFGEEEFSFKVNEVHPNTEAALPTFVHIDTSSHVPSKFTPYEEICDNGFAVFSFSAFEITSNDANFRNGIAKHFGTRRSPYAPGKLCMWAFAAMRVMDYLQMLDYIDTDKVAVIGNGIMGKAALLAAVYDTRFNYVVANSSGRFGASLTKGNTAGSLLDVTDNEAHLFAPALAKRLAKTGKLPSVDQHLLLSLIAPRFVMIGSATGDYNGDIESDFLCGLAASPAYELLGYKGLCHSGALPKAGELLDGGRIIHHVRDGLAYLSRRDWQVYMNVITKL